MTDQDSRLSRLKGSREVSGSFNPQTSFKSRRYKLEVLGHRLVAEKYPHAVYIVHITIHSLSRNAIRASWAKQIMHQDYYHK